MLNTITATVFFDSPFWVVVFERTDEKGYAVARQVFGSEPTDPELYEFLSTHWALLKFTEPQQDINLVVKRKNFKRISREVRQLMKRAEASSGQETLSQEVLRLQLEKNKKAKKIVSKQKKEAERDLKFKLKQEKKKKKHKGR